jgi:hypothetical protein
VGRKNKYETHVHPRFDEIKEWYQDMTEAEIVKRLGISVRAWENYKKEYPELMEVLKDSKTELKHELKESLKKKAKGFTYEETKTIIREENGKQVKVIEKYKKYAQPDTGALHLLLKNLDDSWHNDDKATLDLKRKAQELEEKKLEKREWS